MQELHEKLARSKQVHAARIHAWRKHPFGVPIAVFVALSFVSAIAVVVLAQHNKLSLNSDTHIVIVSHDGDSEAVPTNAHTIGELLQKLNLGVGTYDRVEPGLKTKILQDNFRVNVYRASPITIHDGATMTTSYSAATTARSVVAQSGISVYPEDIITAAPADNILQDHALVQVVTINRSVPINLNIYGTQASVRTHAKTVSALVKEKGITLVDGATLMPAGDTQLTANTQVFVLNKGVSITSTEEVIAMPVQKIDDPSLTLGSTAVRQAGSAGKQLVTYQITVDTNGKEVSRQAIQTIIIQTPVTQIVVVGKNVAVPADKTEIMRAVGIAEGDYGYVDYIVAHEGGWGGATKSNYTGSGAYGICQALPGSKMASAGADWATNPVTQLRWCNGYAVGRYGSWEAAYNFWLSRHYW